MTGSLYGPVPVTGIVKLSVPCQNPGGESPAATPRIPRAWAVPRTWACPCAAGVVTVAVPLVAGVHAAAANGTTSAARPAAPTSRDRAGRGPGLPDPRAPVINYYLLGIIASLRGDLGCHASRRSAVRPRARRPTGLATARRPAARLRSPSRSLR